MADNNNPQIKENYDNDILELKRIADDWIKENEKDSVQDILRRLPPDIREKALEEIEEPTRKQLRELLLDVAPIQITENSWFEDFREVLWERNEVLAKLFEVTDIYFTNRLSESWLSDQETDKIKLVLFDNLLSQLNFEWWMKMVAWKINWKLKQLFNIFSKSSWDKKEEADIASVLEWLEQVWKELVNAEEPTEGKWKELFVYFDGIMGDSFTKIKEEKDKWTLLDNVEWISVNLYWNDKKRTLDDIKNATIKKAKDFDWLKKTWNTMADLLWKLPESWQKTISDFLKDLVSKFPFLWLILGLFFPLDFLESNEENKTKKESIANLIKYSEKEGSPVKWLDEEFFEKLDLKELEDFYKYLDGKEIDYTKKWFWEAIFTWKTNDPKLTWIYDLLKWDNDKFELTDDDKKDNFKWFISKLNGLNIKEQEQKAKEEKSKTESMSEALPVILIPTSVSQDTDSTSEFPEFSNETEWNDDNTWNTPIVENHDQQQPEITPQMKEEYTQYRDQAIKEYIVAAKTLPMPIKYDKKTELDYLGIESPEKIDFVDWKIVVWNKPYQIKIWDFDAHNDKLNNVNITNFLVIAWKIEWDRLNFTEWNIHYKRKEWQSTTATSFFASISWKNEWDISFKDLKAEERYWISKDDIFKMVIWILSWKTEWSFKDEKWIMLTDAKYELIASA